MFGGPTPEPMSQYYIQYGSELYIYRIFDRADASGFYDTDAFLLIIDLNIHWSDPDYYEFPNGASLEYRCVVADAEYVFFFQSGNMYRFEKNTKTWFTTKWIDVKPAACALNEDNADERSIYIFAYRLNSIYKYDINEDQVKILDAHNLCYANYGRAILRKNKKVYLHGCHPRSWKTLIFNFETEEFEKDKIKITDAFLNIESYLPYYPIGQLTTYDDNILMMAYHR